MRFIFIFLFMAANVFIIPGLNNSGPQHWQTLWEEKYGYTRIEQQNWDFPVCKDWITSIDQALSRQKPENVILVCHSLGCCTIAHWALKFQRQIKGALLVGPSDVDAPSYPSGTSGFKPMPLFRLPFPSIVVASSNDPFVELSRAEFFAAAWGSRLVNIGDCGHINAASNLGSWPAGITWIKELDV